MVYRCDDDEIRTLLFASAGSKSLIGLEPAELIGRAAGALLPLTARADRQLVQEEVRWSLLQRRRFELTYRLERPDGVEIWVREQGQGVFNTEGELLFVEGFLTDVTSRRRADEERRRLETRVRRAHKVESLAVLAGGIAHDFNNLLVSVLGNAQFVRDRVTQEDEEARSALRSIESAAERAASLTQYMLAYTGREQISPARLSPTGLVQSSLPMLERSVPSNVVLRATLEADVPPILGDGGQLQRALVEVVRNSGEALGTREGHIELRVQAQEFGTRELAEAWLGARLAPGRYAVIAIADDGPGMDETVRQRAFDPFFTTRGAGRGLGLAAVLGAVRAHGGAMQLESAPGAGTTLRMILPLAQEPEVVLDPAPRVALPTPPQGPLVLVVDDEPLVREVARRALQRAGYRVLCAVDGSDALTQFRAQPQAIDAVLLDLTMPQMTGEETLARLRAERTDLPVLLSSGFAERDVLARLHAHHPVHFLRKPYRLAELVEKMSAALAGPARVP
jgi:two-component system cell cycle sensor histidine kinase/response regulator CckA